MRAPDWIESAVREFGRASGVSSLSLGEKGVLSLTFENGVNVAFEYLEGRLAVTASVPSPADPASISRILLRANPRNAKSRRVRSGYLQKSSRAVFAILVPDVDVTTPVMNSVFSTLWQAAVETGGAR